jgi:hypothetical protein
VRFGLQAAMRCSLTAQPFGAGTLALQVTQHSSLPHAVTVMQQRLHLPPGLSLSSRPGPGPGPPFTIEAGATALSLFLLAFQTGGAATNAINRATLCSMLGVKQEACAALPLEFRDDPDEDMAMGVGRMRTVTTAQMPNALLSVMLLPAHASSPQAPSPAPDAAAAVLHDAAPSATAQRHAALCVHMQPFTLELSSFSAMAVAHAGHGAAKAAAVDIAGNGKVPVVRFMGPRVAQAGRDITLMWQVCWEEGLFDLEPGVPLRHSRPVAGKPTVA